MSAPVHAQAPVYQATMGYLAVEAEAHPTPLPARWQSENLFTGASGGEYLRTTRNSFGTPGLGILSYDFNVDVGGAFQFAMRSQVGEGTSTTDANDTWVRMVDSTGNPLVPRANQNDIRTGQWMKAYQNSIGRWNYQASNLDRVGRSISWQLANNTNYTLQISARSRGLLLDRLFLYDQSLYNLNNEVRGFSTGNSQSGFDALTNSAQVVTVPFILGDADQNGEVTFSDIPSFIEILTIGGFSEQADCNLDGAVNFSDIPALIEILMAI